MSSFVNDYNHVGALRQFVMNSALFNRETFRVCPYPLRDKFPALASCDDRQAQADYLVQKEVDYLFDTIYRLQITCVSLQYKKSDPEGARPREIARQVRFSLAEYKYPEHARQSLSALQAFKLFQCMDYQIETSHLEKLRPLQRDEQDALQWLRLMISGLANWLVCQTAEYKAAKWSLD